MRFDLARRYKRWRHGRGFGIHSPFAYDFITRTLRERMPYYFYERLDAMAAARHLDVADQRRLRLIFRIAVRFNPATAAVIGDHNNVYQKKTLKSARSSIDTNASLPGAALIIINEDCPNVPVMRDGAVCIFPDTQSGGRATCEAVWSATTRGMRFDNADGFTVIVFSDRLPRQQFDVRF